MELTDLITVYSDEHPPRLKPNGYMDEWKWYDFVVTPLMVFKFAHIEILGRGGQEAAVTAVPEKSAQFQAITLPKGHPQPSCVYERHDADAKRYVLPASKDRVQLEEQVHAYSAALAALGAKEISISVDHDDSASGNIGFTVAGGAITVKAQGDQSSTGKSKLSLTLPGHEPRSIGRNPWLRSKKWQSLEQMRMRDGLTSYDWSHNFKASRTRLFDADMSAALVKCGLKIDGRYESLGSSEFSISALF